MDEIVDFSFSQHALALQRFRMIEPSRLIEPISLHVLNFGRVLKKFKCLNVPALAYGSCRVSDQGTTLRASDLHNARATILNPFIKFAINLPGHKGKTPYIKYSFVFPGSRQHGTVE